MSAFPSLGISAMDIVQALLFGLAILLWRVFKLLELMAEHLGCNPHRIKELDKKTDKLLEDAELGRPKKLNEAQEKALYKKLEELNDSAFRERPVRAGATHGRTRAIDEFDQAAQCSVVRADLLDTENFISS